ncbi:response regulator [Permianibacter sp. IMCC34836]|uniref:hybrid sensor histidine kinase/response regulator n=1 Tax=Permianibacter fluminis TaxID=2738515 RepID=UPI0015529C49|nr:PAS-domain containing protein [Permianibacter fluminis]NQD37863.1 response regulator [Permianibacter fluminis]
MPVEMIGHGVMALLALTWVLALFAVALIGDRLAADMHGKQRWLRWHPWVYMLALGVYCTTWTFFGSVGQMASTGWWFPPTYLGAIFLFVFGWRILHKLIRLAKEQNLSSLADLLAARYGRSHAVAALVTVIALIGIIPYIALQLKAVAFSYDLLTRTGDATQISWWQDTALYVTLVMALFTIFFGARHTASSEQQPGLMLAIAFESILKLLALAAVGVLAWQHADMRDWFVRSVPARADNSMLAYTVQAVLGGFAMLCLPRQFHVTVVEHSTSRDLPVARRWYPLYLILLGVFLLPLTLAGEAMLRGTVAPDTYVLNLPMALNQSGLAVLAFIGGLAAATSMVIVASVALSTMVSHTVFVPLLLKWSGPREPWSFNRALLWLRRGLIALVLALAFAYYRLVVARQELAAIGLVSFVAVAQFMPALIGAMYWRTGNRLGALAGLATGWLIWWWTLVVPELIQAGWLPQHWLSEGPGQFSALRPTALLGVTQWDALTHGAIFSLLVNTLLYIGVSLASRQDVLERLQAKRFVEAIARHEESSGWPELTPIAVTDLARVVGRFLGEGAALARFLQEAEARQLPSLDIRADQRWLSFAQRELTGVIGASSARVVLTAALRGRDMPLEDVVQLVDEASAVLQFNQGLLSATLDTLNQGVIVVDRDLRVVAWNPRYVELFALPVDFLYVGRSIADVLKRNAEREQRQEGIELFVERRLAHLRMGQPHHTERQLHDGRVLEIHGLPMPGGGYVTSYSDISEHKRTAAALQQNNDQLEQRVQQRTRELASTNAELAVAKQKAEQADADKTRFLAAASHDLVQPLNAAQLFAGALGEKLTSPDAKALLEQLNQSLHSTEELLKTLLDLSKLDAGVLQPQREAVPLARILKPLRAEFAATAQQQDLLFSVQETAVWVDTDPRMLRRILQNLISNALRYTARGRVHVGVRRVANTIRIEVHDTGIGIAVEQQSRIFEEFRRLQDPAMTVAPGHGLGLAISQRLARALHATIAVQSRPGLGSCFSIAIERTAPMQTPLEPAQPTVGALPFTGLRVLCLDNEPAMLSGLASVLSSWGCQVSTARDRSEFLQAAQQAPEIVLADYQLDQDDNGLAVWSQLPEPRPPLIIISANRDASIRDAVQRAGGDYLAKPVKPLALRGLLQRLRNRSEDVIAESTEID